jgi:hypothetical protein
MHAPIAINTRGRSPNFPGAYRIAWTFSPLNPEDGDAYSGHGQAVFLQAEAIAFCNSILSNKFDGTNYGGHITYRVEEAPRYPQWVNGNE